MDKVVKEPIKNNQKENLEGYLTNIKELPDDVVEEPVKSAPEHVEKPKVKPKAEQVIVENKRQDKTAELEVISENFKVDSFITTKDVILGVVNLISIIFLIILLVQLPKKAQELNQLRKENVLNQTQTTFEPRGLAENVAKANKLENLFINDSGVVDFVSQVEAIKASGGSVSGLSFVNVKAVLDKTGNWGYPVVIELKGNWEQIGNDLQKIQALPFLSRAIKIEAEKSVDDPNVLIFNYGVIIYVSEEAGKN